MPDVLILLKTLIMESKKVKFFIDKNKIIENIKTCIISKISS